MRIEDLDACAGAAMLDFLGIERLNLQSKNVGEQKVYGPAYRAFVEQLRLKPNFIEAMHSTRYARHFYTVEELEQSAARLSA
jgi:hypothetical protein